MSDTWNDNPSESPTPRGPSDGDAAPDARPVDARELVLVKNGQRFVFRCEVGREQSLFDQLVDMVRDPDCDLDWFDAAVLSHQLGQRISQQLDRFTRQHKAAS